MESPMATLHISGAKPKPGLATFPLEILVEIAGHVAQDCVVFPETQTDLEYITHEGEARRYWTWVPWTVKERSKSGIMALRTYSKRPEENSKSILSLSLTCSRLSKACYKVLYRTAIVSGIDYCQLHRFLNTITRDKNAHLQRFVAHMAVTYDFGEDCGCQMSRMSRSIQTTLSSGALILQVLRSLELSQKSGRLVKHLDCWYNLLPELPLLERLTLRGFREVDYNFPALPRLKEAHFYNCSSSDSEHTTKALLEKIPSLRALVNFSSFGKVSNDAFAPVKGTLETLAWVDLVHEYPISRLPNVSCLHKLRHLKTGLLKVKEENGNEGSILWSGKDLAGIDSLETVEFVHSQGGKGSNRFFQGLGLQLILKSMVDTFRTMKWKGEAKGLRIVDTRSFHWIGQAPMKAGFRDDMVNCLEELGVTLLLPEMPTPTRTQSRQKRL